MFPTICSLIFVLFVNSNLAQSLEGSGNAFNQSDGGDSITSPLPDPIGL